MTRMGWGGRAGAHSSSEATVDVRRPNPPQLAACHGYRSSRCLRARGRPASSSSRRRRAAAAVAAWHVCPPPTGAPSTGGRATSRRSVRVRGLPARPKRPRIASRGCLIGWACRSCPGPSAHRTPVVVRASDSHHQVHRDLRRRTQRLAVHRPQQQSAPPRPPSCLVRVDADPGSPSPTTTRPPLLRRVAGQRLADLSAIDDRWRGDRPPAMTKKRA